MTECSSFLFSGSAFSGLKWQRELHGGRHSCLSGRLVVPKMLVPLTHLVQTSTLLHHLSKKTLLLQPPRPPATSLSLNKPPTRAPASIVMTLTTTPNWSRSSTSRPLAGWWRCRAQADLERRGRCARSWIYIKRRRGKRTHDDKEEVEVINDCFMKMLEEKEKFEYMKILQTPEACNIYINGHFGHFLTDLWQSGTETM